MKSNHTENSQPNPILDRVKVPNVILVGATGSGKTTLGLHLARLLGFGLLDLDDVLERRQGRSIESIFAENGELGFRELEADLIASLSNIRNHVIVTGAGAVQADDNWQRLRKLGAVVWVATPVSEIANRLLMDPDELRMRPLLRAAADIEDKETRRQYLHKILAELLEKRVDRYRETDCAFEDRFSTPEMSAHIVKAMLLRLGAPQSSDGRL